MHMTQVCSLLSIVFMMGFVMVFERVHEDRLDSRFCAMNLMGRQDVDRIMQILAACQDG